jgi:hypothetical protein
MRKGLFLGTLGGIENMRPEAHEDGLRSDTYCLPLVCESFVGYVEGMGIEEEAGPVREVVNSHVLAAISSDDG